MGHQVKEWQPHKGADWLHIEWKDSMHYNPLVDKQIRVPIGDINKLRKELKGDGKEAKSEEEIIKTTIKTKIHQVDSYITLKGIDALIITEDDHGVNFDSRVDRQIIVPIPDVEDYLEELKGNGKENGPILTRVKKHDNQN